MGVPGREAWAGVGAAGTRTGQSDAEAKLAGEAAHRTPASEAGRGAPRSEAEQQSWKAELERRAKQQG